MCAPCHACRGVCAWGITRVQVSVHTGPLCTRVGTHTGLMHVCTHVHEAAMCTCGACEQGCAVHPPPHQAGSNPAQGTNGFRMDPSSQPPRSAPKRFPISWRFMSVSPAGDDGWGWSQKPLLFPSPSPGPDPVAPGGTWVLPPQPLPIPPCSISLDLGTGMRVAATPRPGPQLPQSHTPCAAPCLSFPARCPSASTTIFPRLDPCSTKPSAELGCGTARFDGIIPAGRITQGRAAD